MGTDRLAQELLNGASGFHNIKSMLIHLDEIDTIFVLLNRDQQVAYLNLAACDMLNTNYEQAIGKNWFEHFVPRNHQKEAKLNFSDSLLDDVTNRDTYISPILSQNKEVFNIRWDNAFIKHNASGIIAGLFNTGKQLSKSLRVSQDIEIFPDSQIVKVAGEQITLSMSEYSLLQVLAHREGQVVKREFLTRSLRGIDYDFGDRSLDMRISSLRKKLKDNQTPYKYIKTIRSMGYMLIAS